MKTLFQQTLISTLLLVPNLGFADNHSADLGLKSPMPSSKMDLSIPQTSIGKESKDLSNAASLGSKDAQIVIKKPKLGEEERKNKDAMKMRGGGDAGGGDSILLHAVSYPDPAGLNKIIELAINKLKSSSYPEKFQSNVIAEIAALNAADKFRYLPEIILLPSRVAAPDEEGADQTYNSTYGPQFLSLGALTWLRPGAEVIFSDRAMHYSNADLAELLLHEVIHHVVSRSLSRDEVFVDDLAVSIVSQKHDPKLQQALEMQVYLRPQFISRDQLWDALLLESEMNPEYSLQQIARKYVCFVKKSEDQKCVKEVMARAEYYFRSYLPRDLSKVSVGDITNILIHSLIPEHPQLYDKWSLERMFWCFMPVILNRFAKRFNPQAPDLKEKKKYFGPLFENIDEIDSLLMKDYVVPSEP